MVAYWKKVDWKVEMIEMVLRKEMKSMETLRGEERWVFLSQVH